MAKKEMTMKQNTVKVDWHRKTQAMHGQTKSGKRGKMEDKRAGDLLEVTNIPKGCEEDHVKLKVESLVRSDDNSIQEMSYNPSEGRAIVTFIDSKSKSSIYLHERKTVKYINILFIMRPIYENMLVQMHIILDSASLCLNFISNAYVERCLRDYNTIYSYTFKRSF